MSETIRILLIILTILGILGMFSSLFFTEEVPEHYDKCYDKEGNEIIGQICFVEKDMTFNDIGIILIILGGGLGLVSYCTYKFLYQ